MAKSSLNVIDLDRGSGSVTVTSSEQMRVSSAGVSIVEELMTITSPLARRYGYEQSPWDHKA